MYHKITQKLQNKFIKNILLIFSGTLLAQLITLSLSPFVTRLYTPEDLGTLGLFISLAAVLSPLASLSYPLAIPLVNSVREKVGLVFGSLKLVAIVVLVTSFIVVLCKSSVTTSSNLIIIKEYLYLIPVVMFFLSILLILNNISILDKTFHLKGIAALLSSVIVNALKIGMGYIYSSASTLIYLYILGVIIQSIVLSKGYHLIVLPNNWIKFAKLLLSNSVNSTLSRYKNFAIYRTPQTTINIFSQMMPVFLLTLMFGPSATGYYTLTNSILSAPTILLSNAVGDVFVSRASDSYKSNKYLKDLFNKVTFTLLILGIVPTLLLFFYGEMLFEFVFGQGWGKAGEYASWLSFWFFSMLITSPASKILIILEKQSKDLYFTIYKVVVRLVTTIIVYYIFEDDRLVILSFSIVSTVVNIHYLVIVYREVVKYDKLKR